MSGEAGTQMPEHEIDFYHCGTNVAGWLNGNHPEAVGELVEREVCFPDTEPCSYKLQIQVIKCNEWVSDYYIYYFEETPTCYMRYCSI